MNLCRFIGNKKRSGERGSKRAPERHSCKILRFESLEHRTLLTTTLFLDFGFGIGMGNQLSTTAGEFRNIKGDGIHDDGTGPDLTTNLDNNLLSTSSLDFRSLAYDFTLDGSINMQISRHCQTQFCRSFNGLFNRST